MADLRSLVSKNGTTQGITTADTLIVGNKVDAASGQTLTIGGTNATGITIGQGGLTPVTTSFPGPVELTGDVITVGGTTFTTDATFEGNVTFGNGPADTVTFAATTTIVSDINMGGGSPTYKITNLLNPTAAQDAATKDYVDTEIGLAVNVGNTYVAVGDGTGIVGSANLTWSGTDLDVTGAVNIKGGDPRALTVTDVLNTTDILFYDASVEELTLQSTIAPTAVTTIGASQFNISDSSYTAQLSVVPTTSVNLDLYVPVASTVVPAIVAKDTASTAVPLKLDAQEVQVADGTDTLTLTGSSATSSAATLDLEAASSVTATITGGATYLLTPNSVQTGFPTSGALTFDLDPSLTPYKQVGPLTNDISIANASNPGAARSITVEIKGDTTTSRNVTSTPAGWTWLGGAAPTVVPQNATIILSIACFGASNNDVVASWSYDGSLNVTNVTATAPLLSSGGTTPDISISTVGASAGDVLTYNGAAWAAATPAPNSLQAAYETGNTITTSALYGNVTINGTEDFVLGGTVDFNMTSTGAITATALTGTVDIATTGAFSIDGAVDSNINVSGAALLDIGTDTGPLTVYSSTGTVWLNTGNTTVSAIQLATPAGGIDLQAETGVSITSNNGDITAVASGIGNVVIESAAAAVLIDGAANSRFTVTSADLTLETVTSGNVNLTAAASLEISANGNATTWPTAAGAANTFLKNDGAGALSWSAVDLATDVTGTLPVGNGGTGATTLSGYVYGNGTSPFTASATIPGSDVTLTATQIAFGSGTNTITSSAQLTYTSGTSTIGSSGAINITAAGASTWSTSTGNLDVKAGAVLRLDAAVGASVVVNPDGNNVDFRVESDNSAFALFVDASADRVGVFSTTPVAALDLGAGQFAVPRGSVGAPSIALRDNLDSGFFAPTVPSGATVVTNEAIDISLNNSDSAGFRDLSAAGPITATQLFVGVDATDFGVLTLGQRSIGGEAISLASAMIEGHINDTVTGQGAAAALYTYGSTGVASGFIVRRARGDQTTPTAVQSGDLLGSFNASGFDGSAYTTAPGESPGMRAFAAENFTGTNAGASLEFWTVPTGSKTPAARMHIDAGGNVGIGTTTPTTGKLQVAGGSLAADVSALAVTGTINPSSTTNASGAKLSITGSGSGATRQVGLEVRFEEGYTGTAASPVALFANNQNTLGGGLVAIPFGTETAPIGVMANAITTNLSDRSAVGVKGIASQAGNAAKTARSYGAIGLARNGGGNDSTGIGVYGTTGGLATTDVAIGGMFTLYGESDAISTSTLTRAALVADNGAVTNASIFVARDNGTTTFTIADSGYVTSKNTLDSTTAFQVQDQGGTTVLDVDTTNQRVGIATAAPTAALSVAEKFKVDSAGYIVGYDNSAIVNGEILIGNTSAGNRFDKASLSAGTGITITPGAGSITIAANGAAASSAVEVTLDTTAVATQYDVAYVSGSGAVDEADAAAASNPSFPYQNARVLGVVSTAASATGKVVVSGLTTANFTTTVGATLGGPAFLSKTAGKLTWDVSTYSPGDVVSEVGIIVAILSGTTATIAVQPKSISVL